MKDYVSIARQYEDDILSDRVPACRLVKQACVRARHDRERASTAVFPFVYSPKHAGRICQFLELLRHVQGPKADERIVLEPWQVFFLTEVFGWLRVGTETRRFRRVYASIPRGNGKSVLSAGISLYCAFAEKEGGADCIATATTETQAKIVLGTAQAMLRKDGKLATKLGVEVRAHDIIQRKSESKLRGMPPKGTSLEGVSLHMASYDELCFAKKRDTYDSLSTATAKRNQSLLLMISTRGFDLTGIGNEVDAFAVDLLEGNNEATDESFFAIVYTVDEEMEERWDSPEAWRMANPNYGTSVNESVLAEEANRARQMPAQQVSFKTKYVNLWQSSATEEVYLQYADVRKCLDEKLSEKDFVGQPAVYGLDLASRLDLCAAVRVHNRRVDGQVHYYAFCNAWLPSATVDRATNASYRAWIAQKHLVATNGSITDLDVVEAFLLDEFGKFDIRDLAFDPLQSNLLITHLKKQTKRDDSTFVEVGQFAKFLTVGMTTLSEAVVAGRFHTNSPVLTWCLANLRAKYVGSGLVYPVRPKDMTQKIDCAVAAAMALRSCAVLPLDESKKRRPQIHMI